MAVYETPWHKKQREQATNDAGVALDWTDKLATIVNNETDFQLYCDHCNMPTLKPEHAHYRCTNCYQRTSCCEAV